MLIVRPHLILLRTCHVFFPFQLLLSQRRCFIFSSSLFRRALGTASSSYDIHSLIRCNDPILYTLIASALLLVRSLCQGLLSSNTTSPSILPLVCLLASRIIIYSLHQVSLWLLSAPVRPAPFGLTSRHPFLSKQSTHAYRMQRLAHRKHAHDSAVHGSRFGGICHQAWLQLWLDLHYRSCQDAV